MQRVYRYLLWLYFADVSLFRQLRTLDLADNKLSDWASVEMLGRLPQLTSLKLSGNPYNAIPEYMLYQVSPPPPPSHRASMLHV